MPSDQTEISTGTGYDAHALVAGDHVMLCGVRIDHDRTLEGNTDGDVGLHALVDAVLGRSDAVISGGIFLWEMPHGVDVPRAILSGWRGI